MPYFVILLNLIIAHVLKYCEMEKYHHNYKNLKI